MLVIERKIGHKIIIHRRGDRTLLMLKNKIELLKLELRIQTSRFCIVKFIKMHGAHGGGE